MTEEQKTIKYLPNIINNKLINITCSITNDPTIEIKEQSNYNLEQVKLPTSLAFDLYKEPEFKNGCVISLFNPSNIDGEQVIMPSYLKDKELKLSLLSNTSLTENNKTNIKAKLKENLTKHNADVSYIIVQAICNSNIGFENIYMSMKKFNESLENNETKKKVTNEVKKKQASTLSVITNVMKIFLVNIHIIFYFIYKLVIFILFIKNHEITFKKPDISTIGETNTKNFIYDSSFLNILQLSFAGGGGESDESSPVSESGPDDTVKGSVDGSDNPETSKKTTSKFSIKKLLRNGSKTKKINKNKLTETSETIEQNKINEPSGSKIKGKFKFLRYLNPFGTKKKNKSKQQLQEQQTTEPEALAEQPQQQLETKEQPTRPGQENSETGTEATKAENPQQPSQEPEQQQPPEPTEAENPQQPSQEPEQQQPPEPTEAENPQQPSQEPEQQQPPQEQQQQTKHTEEENGSNSNLTTPNDIEKVMKSDEEDNEDNEDLDESDKKTKSVFKSVLTGNFDSAIESIREKFKNLFENNINQLMELDKKINEFLNEIFDNLIKNKETSVVFQLFLTIAEDFLVNFFKELNKEIKKYGIVIEFIDSSNNQNFKSNLQVIVIEILNYIEKNIKESPANSTEPSETTRNISEETITIQSNNKQVTKKDIKDTFRKYLELFKNLTGKNKLYEFIYINLKKDNIVETLKQLKENMNNICQIVITLFVKFMSFFYLKFILITYDNVVDSVVKKEKKSEEKSSSTLELQGTETTNSQAGGLFSSSSKSGNEKLKEKLKNKLLKLYRIGFRIMFSMINNSLTKNFIDFTPLFNIFLLILGVKNGSTEIKSVLDYDEKLDMKYFVYEKNTAGKYLLIQTLQSHNSTTPITPTTSTTTQSTNTTNQCLSKNEFEYKNSINTYDVFTPIVEEFNNILSLVRKNPTTVFSTNPNPQIPDTTGQPSEQQPTQQSQELEPEQQQIGQEQQQLALEPLPQQGGVNYLKRKYRTTKIKKQNKKKQYSNRKVKNFKNKNNNTNKNKNKNSSKNKVLKNKKRQYTKKKIRIY